tara:strand:- start:2288 stop:2800 length:513 start_codon:yes stop_codon:yes gene_type:complete
MDSVLGFVVAFLLMALLFILFVPFYKNGLIEIMGKYGITKITEGTAQVSILQTEQKDVPKRIRPSPDAIGHLALQKSRENSDPEKVEPAKIHAPKQRGGEYGEYGPNGPFNPDDPLDRYRGGDPVMENLNNRELLMAEKFPHGKAHHAHPCHDDIRAHVESVPEEYIQIF